MNRKGHLIIGGMVFLVYIYGITTIIKNTTDSFWFGLLATAIGSILPDFLEPAINRMHRGVCHSRLALKFTMVLFGVTAIIGLFSFSHPDLSKFYLASSFFLGYTFHLLADSTTRAGLPN